MKGVKELAYREWQGGKPAPEQSLELVSLLETEISWSRTSVLEWSSEGLAPHGFYEQQA